MYAPSLPQPVPRPVSPLKARIQQFVERLREYAVLAVVALVVSLLVVASPAHATTSFSIDMAGMMDSAAQIFNGLWPAFAIVVGLGLGIQIIRFIVSSIRGAF